MHDLGNACSSFSEAELKELREIAVLYRDGRGVVMQALNALGSVLEHRLPKIPQNWQSKLGEAVAAALRVSYDFASTAHSENKADGWLKQATQWAQGDTWHTTAAAVSGAFGGLAGFSTTLVELPVTTTIMLHSIQQIAAGYGEDLHDDAVRQQCLGVFALGGPLAEDDEVELELFATRLAMQGSSISQIMKLVVPRFTRAFSEAALTRLAPLIGALAGATVNATFASYYQDMAHVHFRLRRLERDHDPQQVQACFERVLGQARKSRKLVK